MADLQSRQTVPFYSYFTNPSVSPSGNMDSFRSGPDVSSFSAKLPGLIDLAGIAGGAFSSASAANRASNAVPAGSSLRDYLKASYVAGGGAGNRPTNTQLGLPTFGIGPSAPSAGAQDFASRLIGELEKRQKKSEKSINPSGWEKVGGILSAAAPFLSFL